MLTVTVSQKQIWETHFDELSTIDSKFLIFLFINFANQNQKVLIGYESWVWFNKLKRKFFFLSLFNHFFLYLIILCQIFYFDKKKFLFRFFWTIRINKSQKFDVKQTNKSYFNFLIQINPPEIYSVLIIKSLERTWVQQTVHK